MPKDDRAHVWAVDILICDFFKWGNDRQLFLKKIHLSTYT